MKRAFPLVGLTVVSLFCFASDIFAADGFGECVTGGAGGATVTVSNAADFKYYAREDSPYIIEVSGTIDLASIGGKVNIKPNKTIRGVGSNPTIIGNLAFEDDYPVANVIIEELNITNPDDYGEGDGITIKWVSDIFITRCTVYDCPDGCIDITRESDYITVSWCKFYYYDPPDPDHRFVNLIGGGDSHTGDEGKLHITFHHNWWSTMCHERMPRVRYGQVHVYNNYYNCNGNNYCIRSDIKSQLLIQNNYFDHVDEAIEKKDDPTALIEASGNIFDGCTGAMDDGDDDVFDPPYSYSLDSASSVPSIVMAEAGAGDDTTPPAAPTGLSATGGDEMVLLNWNDNGEVDLKGYNVYRSTTPGGNYSQLNGSPLSSSIYIDNNSVTNDTVYYYVVTAVDMALNESNDSNKESATPSTGGSIQLTSADFESGYGEWVNVTGDSDDWTRNSGSTPSSGTGPTGGANGSTWYVYLETSTGDAYNPGDTAYLEGPDINDSNNRTLSFYYHMYGADMGTLNVDVYDVSWNNGIWSISGQQHSSSSAPYTQAIVDLSAYTGTIKIRFRAVAAGGYRGDMAIDDVVVTDWIGGWLYGDFTGDDIVNTYDLSEFCEIWWLVTDCNNTELDLNGDCIINFYEYSLLAENWLKE